MAAAATNTIAEILLTNLASSVNHVPSISMQPISDCPNLSNVQPSDVSIPLISQARQQDGFFQLNNMMVAFCFTASMALALAPMEVHSQLHSSLPWLALAVLLGFTSFVLGEFIDSRFVVTVRVLQNFGQFFTVTAFCMAISLRFPFYFKCTVWAVYSISYLPTLITRSFYLASSVNHVPSNYIRPISDRPNFSDVQASDVSIPHIDLRGLYGPYHSIDIKQIGHACQQDGFFQVKYHGIPDAQISEIKNLAGEYIRLPEGERMKSSSDDPTKTTRLSTSLNVETEKVSNWRDFLRPCYPLEDYVNKWPSNPPSFREDVADYCTSVRGSVLRLLAEDCIEKALDMQGQQLALNYYPPCPQPELTFGLPGHTDPNLITILLEYDVTGLQVLRNGKWIAVDPIPNTFIVNIGDQMQVLSNDQYKSGLHRAAVNCNKERISIPTFYCPSNDALIGPTKDLINDTHPAQSIEILHMQNTMRNSGTKDLQLNVV